MSLANFFDKISLSASQRIKGYDRSCFEKKLLSTCIGIVYGNNCRETSEGKAALDLAVRVLCRLYPNITLLDVSTNSGNIPYNEQLKTLATKINPQINCSDEQIPTVNLVIGEVPGFIRQQPCIYIGSDNWKAYFSTSESRLCHESNNPFGAGTAVCFAIANLFRHIFREELENNPLDQDFCFSVFSQRINAEKEIEPILPGSIPVSFTLVGTGAIGNALLWSFLQLNEISGRITLIDDQVVALSNLQRYVLMLQEHVDQNKIDILKQLFEKYNKLTIEPIHERWQMAAGRLSEEQLQLFVTAIDTPIERLEIQSLLPKVILNAWTGPDAIGVSRHLNFLEDVCLSCLYLPTYKQKSESEKIAESLGNAQLEPFVRQYLANNLPIDDNFVAFLSQNTNIDSQLLYSYKGQLVQIFYSEVICGGRVLRISSNGQMPQDLEVPLAHESILAGLLLGAEVIIHLLQLRTEPIESLTKINMMQPVHNYLLEAESKHHSGLCICQDEVLQRIYAKKWSKD